MNNIFAEMREDQHCRDYIAVDRDGFATDATSPGAVAWCPIGWLMKSLDQDNFHDFPAEVAEIRAVAREYGYEYIITANRDLGWRFIEALKARGI